MEVILLERVRHLGVLGDTVSVKPGYARNFLIPKGKATSATVANRAKFDARRAELEKAQAELLSDAKTRGEKLTNVLITMAVKAGAEGRLFGSVGTQDIADAITSAGVKLAKAEVRLPTGLIRHIGEYDVTLHLHADVNVPIRVSVVAE